MFKDNFMVALKNRIKLVFFDPSISGLFFGALIAFTLFAITTVNPASPEAIRAAVIQCPEMKQQIQGLSEPISKTKLKDSLKACLQVRQQKAAIQDL